MPFHFQIDPTTGNEAEFAQMEQFSVCCHHGQQFLVRQCVQQ